MKRAFVLIMFGMMCQTVISQNITLKFTGTDNIGNYVRLDSVNVKNLNRLWSETIVYPDTVLSFQMTSIDEVQGGVTDINAYPNPFNGATNVTITLPQSRNTIVQLFNLSGQKIAERKMKLESGMSLFEIHLQKAQVYLLVVTTEQSRNTVKLLNRGTNQENSILFHGNSKNIEKRQSSNPFQNGDVLKIVGYTYNNGVVVSSQEIQQQQTVNEDFSIVFSLVLPPIVITSATRNVTGSTAICGGNVTSDGGSAVTARGVCWSTSNNPTISDNHTTDSSGSGSFTSNITMLYSGTTYYVRAYATNPVGTSYGNEVVFLTDTLYPSGFLPGFFSVGFNKQVTFSKGNLQWSATGGGTTPTSHIVANGRSASGTWRFAEHQWDTIGTANNNISSSYLGWIDFFGWGTSGWNSGAIAYQPYSTDSSVANYYPGGSYDNDLTGTYANADWGVYNAIRNGGNLPGLWRTLTKAEWDTLLNFRSTASGIRYAKATVNGLCGVIIAPDNWNRSTQVLDSTNTPNANYNSNVITYSQWITMENAGCVFLPAAGIRYNNTNTFGIYWSATKSFYNFRFKAVQLFFNDVYLLSWDEGDRSMGCSVRLVQDYVLPTVTTSLASNVTDTTAICGGVVSNEGGSTVNARGICWDTVHNPTISNSHTTDSTGMGNFVSNITGLVPGTTYYVRAYATNAVGTSYGNEIAFFTTASYLAGTLSGEFSVDTNRRVHFSKGNLQYTTVGTHATIYNTTPGTWRFAEHQWDIIGAADSNTSPSYSGWIDLFGWGTSGYHYPYDTYNTRYQPYDTITTMVNNAHNRYGYGPSQNMPDQNLTGTSANYDWGIYNAISNGGNQPGLWRTLTKAEWEYLLFNRSTPSGMRFVRATVNGVDGLIIFPDNWNTSIHTFNYYANAQNVITSAQWTTLENAGCVFLPSAGYRQGSSVWDANYNYNCYYWSSTSDNNSGAGLLWVYSSNYRISSFYKGWGLSVRLVRDSLTPVPPVVYNYPTVITTATRNITDCSAISGGIVTDSGGLSIYVRGVCWDTTSNPTISDSHTADSNGSGSFISNITGLLPNTTYHVRAYATNAVGAAYGSEMTFTTMTSLPTVATTSASNITDNSTISGGNVTSDGGVIITARGVCWDTSHNPTTSNSHTTDSAGIGTFTSNITGLLPNTIYYVRAYATNALGTAYGTEIFFHTKDTIEGALPGTFSVGFNRQVRFSIGNLQYTTTNTHAVADSGTAQGLWRFAENQWDIIGQANRNTSSSYRGWIDLFGWGTSGYHNPNDRNNTRYQPYDTSSSSSSATINWYRYGPSGNMADLNLTGTSANYDWGVYNAISNGGNRPGMWRTLTQTEWDTLLSIRTTTSGIRYAKATVNGVPGLIIVPDNWDTLTYALSNTNNSSANFNANIITSVQWAALETSGCAFLPAAGMRSGPSVTSISSNGYYWSTTRYNYMMARLTRFSSSTVSAQTLSRHCGGLAVRLVQDVR